MEKAVPHLEKYVFVCENKKEAGIFCGDTGEKIRTLLRDAVKARGLQGRIRVSKSGCLGACAEGPNVFVMPDSVWFKQVQPGDAEKILNEIISRMKPSP